MKIIPGVVAVLLLVCTSTTSYAERPGDTFNQGNTPGQFGGIDTRQNKNNILVIVADDLGIDILSIYGSGESYPPTPAIDALAADGVLFRNAWAYTVCSPTRASIKTGRYGFRTGVRWVTSQGNSTENLLSLNEFILPEALQTGNYAHAAIGKWHLSNGSVGPDGPNKSGYSHYAGALFNITDYYNWPRTVNGVTRISQTYATTANVDDALRWIRNQDYNQPWFMWLAFNTPHKPFHIPPPGLHSYEELKGLSECPDDRICYRAMVEAMDREIGRLLHSLPVSTREKTTVIFLGDNGTPGEATIPKSTKVKGTLYEGGIHVPLIISGAGVDLRNRESHALVNTTDLFATILDIARVNTAALPVITPLDSISLMPELKKGYIQPFNRKFAYSEALRPFASADDGRTIRDNRYKLIRFHDQNRAEEFYDLQLDPQEENNLLVTGIPPGASLFLNRLRIQMDFLSGQ